MDYKAWEENLKDEQDYWKWVIADKVESFVNEQKISFRLDPNTEIQDFIKPYITIKGKILDVGAGPVTFLGKIYEGSRLNISAVDVLADKYNELLKEQGLTAPIETKKGSYENITDLFWEDHFDLIYTHNSLDHCYNPIQAIQNMLNVCKYNGFIYIQVYENEAERCNWQGLHQWNFNIQDDKLLLSNKTENYEINKVIPFPVIKLKKAEVDGLIEITAVIHKAL